MRTESIPGGDRSNDLAERTFTGLVLGTDSVFVLVSVVNIHVAVGGLAGAEQVREPQEPVAVGLGALDHVAAHRRSAVVSRHVPQ